MAARHVLTPAHNRTRCTLFPRALGLPSAATHAAVGVRTGSACTATRLEADDELREELNFDLTCVMLETEPLAWDVSIELRRKVTASRQDGEEGQDTPAESTIETTVEALSPPTISLVARDIKTSSKVRPSLTLILMYLVLMCGCSWSALLATSTPPTTARVN